MKSFIFTIVFVATMSIQSLAFEGDCVTGKCLKAPLKAVGTVAERVVESKPVQTVQAVTTRTVQRCATVARRPFRLFRR